MNPSVQTDIVADSSYFEGSRPLGRLEPSIRRIQNQIPAVSGATAGKGQVITFQIPSNQDLSLTNVYFSAFIQAVGGAVPAAVTDGAVLFKKGPCFIQRLRLLSGSRPIQEINEHDLLFNMISMHQTYEHLNSQGAVLYNMGVDEIRAGKMPTAVLPTGTVRTTVTPQTASFAVATGSANVADIAFTTTSAAASAQSFAQYVSDEDYRVAIAPASGGAGVRRDPREIRFQLLPQMMPWARAAFAHGQSGEQLVLELTVNSDMWQIYQVMDMTPDLTTLANRISMPTDISITQPTLYCDFVRISESAQKNLRSLVQSPAGLSYLYAGCTHEQYPFGAVTGSTQKRFTVQTRAKSIQYLCWILKPRFGQSENAAATIRQFANYDTLLDDGLTTYGRRIGNVNLLYNGQPLPFTHKQLTRTGQIIETARMFSSSVGGVDDKPRSYGWDSYQRDVTGDNVGGPLSTTPMAWYDSVGSADVAQLDFRTAAFLFQSRSGYGVIDLRSTEQAWDQYVTRGGLDNASNGSDLVLEFTIDSAFPTAFRNLDLHIHVIYESEVALSAMGSRVFM